MPVIKHHNELAKRLNESLDGWYVEGDGEDAAYAYNMDIREDPPEEDVVSVLVRNTNEVVWVATYAYNEERGMGDLVESEEFNTEEAAFENVPRFAEDVLSNV